MDVAANPRQRHVTPLLPLFCASGKNELGTDVSLTHKAVPEHDRHS